MTTITETKNSYINDSEKLPIERTTRVSHLYKRILQMDMILTKINIINGKDGSVKKIPSWICPKEKPDDYPDDLYTLPFNLWTTEMVKLHNDYVLQTNKKPTDIVGIPNSRPCMVCLDVDSKDELKRLEELGFPVKTCIHTKSVRKKLPHFYFYITLATKKVLGKKYGRELDMLTDCVYEDMSGKVYGDTLYTFNWRFVEIMFGMEDGELHKNYFSGGKWKEREDRQAKDKPKPKQTDIPTGPSKPADAGSWDALPKGIKVYTEDNELIPLTILDKVLSALNFEKLDNYQDWFRLTCAVANNIPNNCDPNTYLNMYVSHTQKFPTYKLEYDEENRDVFYDVIKNSLFNKGKKKVTSRTLWWWLKEHNYDAWKKLAFHRDRELDAVEFAELNKKEGYEVFNDHIAFVKNGNSPVYVEWNGQINDFVVYTEDKLKQSFQHFAFKDKKKNKDTGEEEQVIEKPGFIKEWIGWKGKKVYNRQTFAPPPASVPYGSFNYYRGFAIDKVNDYDDVVNTLTKEQLEDELDFMLNHLRILSGDDMTELVFDFQLKYFAHMLKFPGILPRVMILWVGAQGCGKNQMLNFHANMIGDIYYTSTEKLDELFGKFNDSASHKILINVNEMEGAYEVMKNIKTMVTEKQVRTTKKFCETIALPNFARMIATSNKQYSMPVEEGDRRTAVVRCSSRIVAGDPIERMEYNTTLAENVDDLYIQKCWIRYCREFVDVTEDYNFEKNRPITTEWLKMKRQNAPCSHRFFQYLYECGLCDKTYTKGRLFNMFNKDFKEIYNEAKVQMSSNKFTNMLEDFIINDTDLDGKPKKEPSLDYLERNPERFIELTKTDRYKYTLLGERVKNFLDINKYQYDEPATSWSDESDDDE